MRLIIALLLILFSSATGYGIEIKIVTEHFPPYQIVENNKIIGGLSIDIVNELLYETGIDAKIAAYPWARAYRTALHE